MICIRVVKNVKAKKITKANNTKKVQREGPMLHIGICPFLYYFMKKQDILPIF